MILLDTNALYYASKMSCPESINIEALSDYIQENRGKVCILSATVSEIICKYHSFPNEIKNLNDYIDNNRIQIIEDGYYTSKMPCVENTEYAFKICVTQRTSVESSFVQNAICVYLTIVLFALAIDLSTPRADVDEIIIKLINIAKMVCKDSLPGLLEASYYDKQKAKSVNASLDKLMDFFAQTTLTQGKIIFSSYDNDFDANLYKCIKIRKKDSTISQLNKIIKRAEEKNSNFNEKIKNIVTAIEKGISEHDTISQDRLPYMVYKMIQSGRFIHINDIIDGLMLSRVSDEDLLISFDKDINDSMKCHPERYKNSISLIDSMKKPF